MQITTSESRGTVWWTPIFACGKIGSRDITLLSNSALGAKVVKYTSAKPDIVKNWELLSNQGNPFSSLIITNKEKEVVGVVPMDLDESGELQVGGVGDVDVIAHAHRWLYQAYLPLLQERGITTVRAPTPNPQQEALPAADWIFLWTPICAESKLGSAHRIKTITQDDSLENEVAQFLGSEGALPLYGEQKRYSSAEAKESVSAWRKRLNEGNPYSCLAILDTAKKVAGLIWMHVEEGALHVTGMGKKGQDNEIVFEALPWILHAYLPYLRGPHLDKIITTASPCFRESFSRAGFTNMGRVPLFQWQKLRSLYEVARLLYNICLVLIEEIMAGNFCPWRGRLREVYVIRLGV